MTSATNIAKDIQKYLGKHETEMLDFLKKIVAMESPSQSVRSLHEIFLVLSKALNSVGYYTLHVPGHKSGGYLYARPKQRKKGIPVQLLVGHCDTVWPLDTLQDIKIEKKGKRLKGPGVYDMKAGITQMLFALKTIMELNLETEVIPVILINSDEEIGSHESTHMISRLAKISERAYVLEPPLGLDGKLKTGRKGIGRFNITVKGKAAHAGLDPTKGVNAIVELSHQVQKLFGMNDLNRGITVNVGMIEGGISANVIAPTSKAVVDVRVENIEDGEYITDQILSLKPTLPDVTLKIEGGIGRPPMEKNERNEQLWNKAKELGKELGMTLEDATVGGGSDANTTSQHTATLDGLGTPGDGAHADHEFIFHERLKERTALLVLLLLSKPIKK
ncbi:MAG: M20 family metallopeptidase [Bacteroidia bacterium]|nr:M20 family metallopeptidase [Bacteroidia bacterium]NNF31661.1 M20 family metallopeptidase [Flavobacteriaceae bacterium]MBT8276717.1 M20 family metallopeptidase [Bacteroidia bacterium]NNJ82829.1 M20 family metallopeptidase [Flavobacteriaceae bacterium]NNK55175.1 M20 family metallopeptidase [Flavobacteriaceae bacterium]